jgi:hypothetical protein
VDFNILTQVCTRWKLKRPPSLTIGPSDQNGSQD